MYICVVTVGQAMYEQTVKILIAFDKQHSIIAMLLTSWSFTRAKPYGKKHKLLRSGWPAAAPTVAKHRKMCASKAMVKRLLFNTHRGKTALLLVIVKIKYNCHLLLVKVALCKMCIQNLKDCRWLVFIIICDTVHLYVTRQYKYYSLKL